MRAYNRKNKPKHTTKPKWDFRYAMTLWSYKVKEKKYKILL